MNSEYFVGKTRLVPSTPKVYAKVPVVVFWPVWTSRTVDFTRTWTLLDSVSGVAVSKSESLLLPLNSKWTRRHRYTEFDMRLGLWEERHDVARGKEVGGVPC